MQSTETIPDETAGDFRPQPGPQRRGRRRWGAQQWVPTISFLVGAVAVTMFFAIGAWQRRWIADDGLIVLRTLRNLFAGNGPVFNAGERVEANTSTAWTYVLWFWAWVTGGQLEYVALWVALVLSLSAIPIAMYGTARLMRTRFGGLTGNGYTLLLPFGAIIYIALPPARDFATSGLENGLAIFWVAVLWCQLVAWSRRRRGGVAANTATLLLAFTAGLAPLIRPELAVFGGLVLLLVVLAPLSWPMRFGVVVVAAVLPVGYQIFRMGYYALLVPNPAVAKDASGSKWHQGFVYLANLFGPYALLLPVILAIIAGILLVIAYRGRGQQEAAGTGETAVRQTAGTETAPTAGTEARGTEAAGTETVALETAGTEAARTETAGTETAAPEAADAGTAAPDAADPDSATSQAATAPEPAAPETAAPETAAPETAAPKGWRGRVSGWSSGLQTPTAVVVTVIVAGLIGGLYWMRQGGDFMHGRVLLVPLFTLLLPLMVLPITLPARSTSAADDAVPARSRRSPRLQLATAGVLAAMWVTTVVWAVVCHQNTLPNAGIDIGRSGIVDERRFYVTNMGNENPVTASDYLDYPRMRAMAEWIDEFHSQGGVILPSSNYDEWFIAKLPDDTPQDKRKLTVYFLNLGMTSMNAPLDVRVVDQMGLAYPLAAHTERLTDGRIGHDKNLPSEWVVAESGAYPRKPGLPGYLDEDVVRQAEVALTCPATKDRFVSYESAWTFARFKQNLRKSFEFTDYRIEREPEYEILRCGLTMPPRIHPK
ncbi:hypothetical protein ACWDTI_03445 [Gordonia sp. NPDC003424]